jgi:hypothetical protein
MACCWCAFSCRQPCIYLRASSLPQGWFAACGTDAIASNHTQIIASPLARMRATFLRLSSKRHLAMLLLLAGITRHQVSPVSPGVMSSPMVPPHSPSWSKCVHTKVNSRPSSLRLNLEAHAGRQPFITQAGHCSWSDQSTHALDQLWVMPQGEHSGTAQLCAVLHAQPH